MVTPTLPPVPADSSGWSSWQKWTQGTLAAIFAMLGLILLSVQSIDVKTASPPTTVVSSSTVAPTVVVPTTPPAATTVAATTTSRPTTTVPISTLPAPTTTVAPTTTSPPVAQAAWPQTNPAPICGSPALAAGPASAPTGATVVPAGDNSSLTFAFRVAGATFWFAPGVHTLGSGPFAQIQPGAGSTFLGAPGAIIDGQGQNRYAFTATAAGVHLAYLEVRNFVSPNDEGVINHDRGRGWTMDHLYAHANKGAAVMVGTDGVLRDSCLADNGQYGFQVLGAATEVGPSNVLLTHNEIVHNDVDDIEHTAAACGCTGGGKFWAATHVTVTQNWVHKNLSVGLWADTNDSDFTITDNWIEDNYAEGVFYEISYNLELARNAIRRNTAGKGGEFKARGDNFPVSAVYLSEAGGDARVGGAPLVNVHDNLLEDNWGGVTLWENADRYCSSGANTSTGYCTLIPGVSLAQCSMPNVQTVPFIDDCRWKTQNVLVTRNTFRLTAAAPCADFYCERQAIVSNCGTIAPFTSCAVQTKITQAQNNHFTANSYQGPWKFLLLQPGQGGTLAQWQAAPYAQDVGSSALP